MIDLCAIVIITKMPQGNKKNKNKKVKVFLNAMSNFVIDISISNI